MELKLDFIEENRLREWFLMGSWVSLRLVEGIEASVSLMAMVASGYSVSRYRNLWVGYCNFGLHPQEFASGFILGNFEDDGGFSGPMCILRSFVPRCHDCASLWCEGY